MKYLGNRWTDLRQIHTEDVFGPSLGQVWTLKVKVKGQRSRSDNQGQKRHFSALLASCVRFMFGKTSLASSLFAFTVCCSCLFLLCNACVCHAINKRQLTYLLIFLLFFSCTGCHKSLPMTTVSPGWDVSPNWQFSHRIPIICCPHKRFCD